jgi:hypothetical protein
MIGWAWARSRISSIITDAIVMAFRQERARSGSSCPVTAPDLVGVSGGLAEELVDLGDEVATYACVWHGASTSVSRGPAVSAVRPPLGLSARRYVQCQTGPSDTAVTHEGVRRTPH